MTSAGSRTGAWREACDPIPTVRGGLGRLASFLGGERGARNVLYYG